MYRPTFPLVAVNQIDIQATSKTVTSGHSSPMPLGPALCEDGHPFLSDPVTGRKMCTCSLGLEVTYDPRSVMSDARKQGMALSGTIGGPSMGMDTSAFYPPLVRGIPVRQDRLPPYLTSAMPGQPLNFDPALAAHPYGLLYAGMDVNGGPIRKAATRETTGPLKIWLSEHKKNPYPTKAEKIMLAIITRMTLTQVSTWFANARRRLKKDNRLSPGGGEDDNVGIDSDRDDLDSLPVVEMEGKVKPPHRTGVPLSSEGEGEPDSFSDISDDDNEVFRRDSRDRSTTPSTNRIPVITSTPEVNATNIFANSPDTTTASTLPTTPETAPSNIFASSPDSVTLKTFATSPKNSPSKIFASTPAKSPMLPDFPSVETPKTKPKIWSISNILDS